MLKNILSILINKYFIVLSGLILLFPYIYEIAPVRIDYTQDVSLKQNTWITYKGYDQLLNYVLFRPSKKQFNTTNNDLLLMKKVFCKENQYLVIDESLNLAKCNKDSILLNYRNTTDLNRFSFRGTIPANKLFVIGTHKDSYDSRYFGFIDKSQIKRSARALN